MSVLSKITDAFYSLGADVNKAKGRVNEETQEGIVGPKLPELALEMDDAKLLQLTLEWEKVWNESPVKTDFEKAGEENENYWRGQQFNRPQADNTRPIKDNVIFEGLETYLPQVTRRNPEPMVALANGVEKSKPNEAWAHALQLELGQVADDVKLRLKLKGAARNHEIRLLGILKFGWDLDNDRPAVKVLRPTKIILDPDATVDEDGYTGDRIGESRKLPAWKIKAILEKDPGSAKKLEWLKEKVKDEWATEVGFVEWWTPDYLCWKCDKEILLKRKNPHWNYEPTPDVVTAESGGLQTEKPKEDVQATPELPQGAPALPEIPEAAAAPLPALPNHFNTRRMPYVFMATFTLGKQPVNVTSNISQNLSNQDLINKRIKQIDRSADTGINGMVVSLARSGLTQPQAEGVTKALRNNGVVAIPDGKPEDAIWKPPSTELPLYIYNNLVDTRQRVRDIWGTRGVSPAGQQTEKTVRGKIQNTMLDTDRIGGGISEYLEQMADDAYNWITQLLYVYDDRFLQGFSTGITPPKVKISVKEGSLLPKDSMTIANQAIDLAVNGKMSTVDMYRRLDYPNPEELAANAWLEVNAPHLLFANDPRVMQAIQAKAGQQEKPPSESINFKDLPPDGQAQMAAKVGIQLHPEAIAAHEDAKAEKERSRAEASKPPEGDKKP